MNCHTTAATDQEDGAPHRGEREAKGGDENDGENIHRAQCKRDLVESNARDLEYQKGALSKQLKIIFEQLERTSEQLKSISD